MPATRKPRASSGAIAKSSQKTISFNSNLTKSHPSRLSGKDKDTPIKPSVTTLNPKSPVLPTPALNDSSLGHTSTTVEAVAQQAQVELKKEEKSETEKRAAKVSDAQIKRYWSEREKERRAPRVHQEGLGVEEKVLRLFDMSSQFGPAIGIARMKRWTRAEKLGLAPPIEVLAVLLKEEKKGNVGIERAYVDELMSSKFVIGDAA